MDLDGDSPSATMTGRSVPILNFPATKHFMGFKAFKVDMARLWSRKEEDGVAADEADEEGVDEEEEELDEATESAAAEGDADEVDVDDDTEEPPISAADKLESEARILAWTKLSALSSWEASTVLSESMSAVSSAEITFLTSLYKLDVEDVEALHSSESFSLFFVHTSEGLGSRFVCEQPHEDTEADEEEAEEESPSSDADSISFGLAASSTGSGYEDPRSDIVSISSASSADDVTTESSILELSELNINSCKQQHRVIKFLFIFPT